MSLTAYIDNDNLLKLTALKNAATGAYINDATVNATLYDPAGTVVSGADNFSLTPTGTSGEYRATLPDTLSLVPGNYRLVVTANAGAGLQGNWPLAVTVDYRTS